MKFYLYYRLIVSLFFLINIAWTSHGPNGGTFSYFASVDSNTIIAGNSDEAYRSNNNGKTWKKLPKRGIIRTTAIPGHLILYDWRGTVFYSEDKGITWEKRYEFLTNGILHDIAPAKSSTEIYALVGSSLKFQFMVSNDFGRTWEKRANIIPSRGQYNNRIIPSKNRIYVIIEARIFKSENSGRTWRKLGTSGLPCCPIVLSLEIDPKNPETLYLSTEFGIFKTVDDGRTWKKSISGNFTSVVVDPKNPKVLYAVGPRASNSSTSGSVKSVNAGINWKDLVLPKIAFTTVFLHQSFPEIIFIGTQGDGIIKSIDEGTTWVKSNNGLNSVQLSQLNATDKGFFARTNNLMFFKPHGKQWIQTPNTNFERINFIKSNSVTLLAGVCCPERTLLSSDFGSTWNVIYQGVAPWLAEIDSRQAKTVYHVFDSNQSRRTLDGGKTWEEMARINPQDIITAISRGNEGGSLWIGTDSGNVYRSENGGTSWIKTAQLGAKNIYEITVDPKNSNIIYVGGVLGTSSINKRSALFRTNNKGISWQLISDGAPGMLRINPTRTYEIFAVSPELLVSTDSGKNWKPFESIPKTISGVYDLTFDRNKPNVIYIATSNGMFSQSLQ